MRATSTRVLAVLILLLPFAVISTPPSIPFDVFQVGGTLTRGGGEPSNHTVVLVRKDYCEGAYRWCVLDNCDVEEAARYGPYVSVDLTSDEGRFSLRVAVCEPSFAPDTIAVAVVYPDTLLVGDPFVTTALDYTPITRTGHREEDGFFCDDTEEFEYEAGRIYTFASATVTVP